MDPRQAHYDAAMAARAAVGEVQEGLSLVTDRAENAFTTIIYATGNPAQTESGQNAQRFMAEVQERINEIYRMTEQITAELDRYAGGF